MKFKKLIAGALVAAMAVSMAACSSGGTDTSSAGAESGTTASSAAPKKGGTLTVGLSAAPVSANIWVQNDINANVIMNLVCPSLVSMDEKGQKYNYLIDSATANDDCTEWTVKLKDLKWNDGTPVTADDLAFTVTYGAEHKIGFSDSYFGQVENAEVKDDKTVLFHLSKPDVNFVNGGGYWIPLMRKSEFESVDDPMNHTYSGAGYGPFYIDKWEDGQYVDLKRNPNFTQANDGQGAYLDEVMFRIYTDENAMVLALENGEIDVCGNYISSNSKTQLANNSQYQLTDIESLGYGQLSYSQTNDLLTDVNIRKALSMCVDRDAMVNVGMSGAAKAMMTPVSPVYSQFTASNIQQPGYDIDGAKALLEQAGFTDKDGDGVLENADGGKLEFTVTYKSSIQNVDNVMEILRSSAEKAGIKLNLEPVDASTYSSKVTNGHTFDIAYNVWGTIDDVDTTLYTCYGIGQTLNFMEYNNKEMDDLLIQMKSTPSADDRAKLLDQWQQLWVDNMPCAFTYVPVQTYAANTAKFGGFKAVFGNNGYLGCAQASEIYAK